MYISSLAISREKMVFNVLQRFLYHRYLNIWTTQYAKTLVLAAQIDDRISARAAGALLREERGQGIEGEAARGRYPGAFVGSVTGGGRWMQVGEGDVLREQR